MVNNLVPSVLNLELTNACNLECVFCDHKRLEKHMEIKELDCDLLEKILMDVSGLHIFELGLVGLGEPLLDRNFSKHLNIIDAYKDNFSRISLNTNAVLLNKAKSERICESVINFVTISLNATNRESYLKLMGRDKFYVVLENIRHFLEIRRKNNREDIKVNIQTMSSKINESKEFKEELANYMYDNVFIYERDVYNKPSLSGNYDFNIISGDKAQRYPCWSIFSRIYIDVNGYFYPCTIGNDCYREKSNLMIGNVKNKPVIILFNSEYLEESRKRALGSALPFPECLKCNVWLLLPNNFEWDNLKKIWVKQGQLTRTEGYDHVSSGDI